MYDLKLFHESSITMPYTVFYIKKNLHWNDFFNLPLCYIAQTTLFKSINPKISITSLTKIFSIFSDTPGIREIKLNVTNIFTNYI